MSSGGSHDFDMEAQETLLMTSLPEFEAQSLPNVKIRKAFYKVYSIVLFKFAAANACSSASVIRNHDHELKLTEDYDIEAQESLLETASPEFQPQSQTLPTAKIRTAIYQLYAVLRFKYAAANARSDYDAIGSHDQELELIEGSEDGAVTGDSSVTVETENQLKLKRINEIVREKNVDELVRYGGVGGIAEALNSDLEKGISIVPEEITAVQRGWKSRVIITFLHSLLVACNNYTVILLLIAALLSLVFGINEEGIDNGWSNGTLILLIVFALVTCSSILNFRQEIMIWKKSEAKLMLKVRVVRQDHSDFILQSALHIGDLVDLKKGDQVPADGIFVKGQGLELDDGSTNPISVNETNPFISYPSRVINGDARMIVTATGTGTAYGEMLSEALKLHGNTCEFEDYMHKVSTCTHVAGLILSILIIVVLFLRFKAGKSDDENGTYRPDPKGEPTRAKTFLQEISKILSELKGSSVRSLTEKLGVLLLGIMDGMPFVISIAIRIWNTKALACMTSVRDDLACVKMASTTTICSDRLGLTEHEFVIDKFFVGGELVGESSVVASNVLKQLCDGARSMFLISPAGGCGPKLEILVSWAEAKLGMKEGLLRQQFSVVSSECCNPFHECCQVFMDKGEIEEGQSRCYFYTGPPQHILSLCSHYYDTEGLEHELDGNRRKVFDQVIRQMVTEGCEMVAYAREQLNGCESCDEFPIETNVIVFMGMIGLEETKTEDTRSAISTLVRNGIKTVLASGDDVEILKTMGHARGIYDPNDSCSLVLTGQEFRDMTHEERLECVKQISIIGNCLTPDKILLIKSLQERGEVVALVAQHTIDAPALLQADIGLAFGAWSSTIAREFSDVHIHIHCCFNAVATAIKTGRCLKHNIRKFTQEVLLFTISSSTINFIAIIVWGDAPMTTIQTLYLNLVVAFIGGAALLMGPPTEQLMMNSPNSFEKLITKSMMRNIAIQAMYQISITVALQHKGQAILGISEGRVKSMIFNIFFICQAFNMFIAREPEKKNILNGLCKKTKWFWVALVLVIMCQIGFGVVAKVVGSSPELTWKLCGLCLTIGLVSWPLDLTGKICGHIFGKVT